MALIKNTISVPANGEVANVLADIGSAFQFLPFDAALSIGMRQQSGSIGDILATVRAGTDVLQEEGPIDQASGFPNPDNDSFLEDVAAAGEQILIKFRNTTAGAITVAFVIEVDQAA